MVSRLEGLVDLYRTVIDAIRAFGDSVSIHDRLLGTWIGLAGFFSFAVLTAALLRARRIPTPTDEEQTWELERIKGLSPKRFEELVPRLWSQMGYRARVTPPPPARDGGIDVLAYKKRFLWVGFGRPLGIQARRYTNRPSGVSTVRECAGVASNPQNAIDRMSIVTTSKFTRGAKEEARQLPTIEELVDGEELVARLNIYLGSDGGGTSRRLRQVVCGLGWALAGCMLVGSALLAIGLVGGMR